MFAFKFQLNSMEKLLTYWLLSFIINNRKINDGLT